MSLLSVNYYKGYHRNQKAQAGLCTKSYCISKICTAGGRNLPKTEQEDTGRDYKPQELGMWHGFSWLSIGIQLWALVNPVTKLQVPWKTDNSWFYILEILVFQVSLWPSQALISLQGPNYCPLIGHKPRLLLACSLDITPWEDIYI